MSILNICTDILLQILLYAREDDNYTITRTDYVSGVMKYKRRNISGVRNLVLVCKTFKKLIESYIRRLMGTLPPWPIRENYPSKNSYKRAIKMRTTIGEPFFSYFCIPKLEVVASLKTMDARLWKLPKDKKLRSSGTIDAHFKWNFVECGNSYERALVHRAAGNSVVLSLNIFQKEMDYIIKLASDIMLPMAIIIKNMKVGLMKLIVVDVIDAKNGNQKSLEF
jgi:hypothetical protein